MAESYADMFNTISRALAGEEQPLQEAGDQKVEFDDNIPVLSDVLPEEEVVEAAAEEVAKLTPGEAEQIFDNLARNIQSVDDLKAKPDGVEGIKELCKVSPSLQTPTIALLASLPPSKLGPWVVAGWKDVITHGSAKGQLEQLIQSWASQEENKMLRQAATVATGKGKGG